MTAVELFGGSNLPVEVFDYDVTHNGLIVSAVVVNHEDRTVELVTS